MQRTQMFQAIKFIFLTYIYKNHYCVSIKSYIFTDFKKNSFFSVDENILTRVVTAYVVKCSSFLKMLHTFSKKLIVIKKMFYCYAILVFYLVFKYVQYIIYATVQGSLIKRQTKEFFLKQKGNHLKETVLHTTIYYLFLKAFQPVN